MIDFNKFCNSETLYDIKNINHVESDLYVKNGVMYNKMNLSYRYVLNSNLYSFSEKIECFKQIGLILDKMKNVRDNTNIKDFYLCDLYTDNFILNTDTNRINVIDMDSCKINGNNNCSSY